MQEPSPLASLLAASLPWFLGCALLFLAAALMLCVIRQRAASAVWIRRGAPRLAVAVAATVTLAWWRADVWTSQPPIVGATAIVAVAIVAFGVVTWVERIATGAR
ncbi:hypothetical protein CSW60_18450 [Caulobacter sp. X]|nr:hypothetical protein CSW60_18450 [Caulobacter sp. X]